MNFGCGVKLIAMVAFLVTTTASARAAESVTFRVTIMLLGMETGDHTQFRTAPVMPSAPGLYLVSRSRQPLYLTTDAPPDSSIPFQADEAFTIAAQPRDRLHFGLTIQPSGDVYSAPEGIPLFDKGGRAVYGDQTMKVVRWPAGKHDNASAPQVAPASRAVLRVTVLPIRTMRRPTRS